MVVSKSLKLQGALSGFKEILFTTNYPANHFYFYLCIVFSAIRMLIWLTALEIAKYDLFTGQNLFSREGGAGEGF